MTAFIKKILSCPVAILALVTLACVVSLGTAFLTEKFLDLKPCNLCIYQRYPFAIGIFLGIIGFAFHKNKTAISIILGLCSLTFLSNSFIAFYHTGVEQLWWESILEGCSISTFGNNTNKSALESIMGAPMTSCKDIAWQDPFFGFSMANYNIVFCLCLSLFCLLGAIFIRKSAAPLPKE